MGAQGTKPLVTGRFALSINGVTPDESSLTTFVGAPIEPYVTSAFESAEALVLVDESNPQWVKVTSTLSEEERIARVKEMTSKELEGYAAEINRRAADLKKKGGIVLNDNDLTSILLYIEENNSDFLIPVYKTVNKALVERSRQTVKSYGPYVLNLLSALRKLPLYEGDVLYRGMNYSLNSISSVIGSELSWPGFTSTTRSLEVAKEFATRGAEVPNNDHCIFEIRGHFRGYDISRFSECPEEGTFQTSICQSNGFM